MARGGVLDNVFNIPRFVFFYNRIVSSAADCLCGTCCKSPIDCGKSTGDDFNVYNRSNYHRDLLGNNSIVRHFINVSVGIVCFFGPFPFSKPANRPSAPPMPSDIIKSKFGKRQSKHLDPLIQQRPPCARGHRAGVYVKTKDRS